MSNSGQIRKTKIVCTLGPASSSEKMIEQLIDAGMNVARLNFSHNTHDYHKEVIDNVKRVRARLKTPIAIMLDTKGPEIRLRTFENDSVILKEGCRKRKRVFDIISRPAVTA